ncbi:MAG: ATP-binding protein, partial [Desulfuromusa sp.]|nr:ATP-binding protein [Desulfuromusa sp.]
VQQSAENLLGLLNDILDFSKIEVGQLQLNNSPFDLAQLLHNVISTMNVSAVEKGLQLQLISRNSLPDSVVGDDSRLRQILINLVGNAIKFTQSGSIIIDVDIENISNEKAVLHFIVTDTGIGISPEKIPLIFNNFEQADNSYARRYGGTGLGLAICKQLTALMAGSLWVESQVNIGSSFHFTIQLPICAEKLPKTAAPKGYRPESAIKGLNILIVDDNEVNREVASLMLEQDHVVATATNGVEALTALAARRVDVIFMDVQMPVMDGLEATTIIRSIEKGNPAPDSLPDEIKRSLAGKLTGKYVPIVAMTAHAMIEDQEMCFSVGMDRYVTKPFKCDHLISALESAIGETSSCCAPGQVSLADDLACPIDIVPDAARVEDITGYFKTTTNFTDEQISRLVSASCKSINENLEKAMAALQGQDYPALGRAAHTLKGTLAQCGFSVWAEKAQDIHTNAGINHDYPFMDHLDIIKKGAHALLEYQ